MSHDLTVIEQRNVVFYGDEVLAVLAERPDGTRDVFIPVRPVCDLLGVAWSAQRLRINRDPVLQPELTPVIVTITGHAHGKHTRPHESGHIWFISSRHQSTGEPKSPVSGKMV